MLLRAVEQRAVKSRCVLLVEGQEDIQQHMYDLMQQRHQSWSKDKTASKLMEQMDLADLQDYYEKDGQKHRELVEYFLQIDRFIDSLA